MSRLILLCLLLLAAFAPVKTAHADIMVSYSDVVVNKEYSGTYMFTVSGNDSLRLRNNGTSSDAPQLLQFVNQWFSDHTNLGDKYLSLLGIYAKYENGASNGNLSVEYGDSQRYGTWTADSAIEFYAVKAGNSFALYWLGEGGAASGAWTAEHVARVGNGNIPELSHFTGYNPTVPAPEPASLLLLGTGLFASIAVCRKKRRG